MGKATILLGSLLLGGSAIAQTDALTVDQAGQVGVGTATPTELLHVFDGNASAGARTLLRLDNLGAPALDFVDRNRNIVWRMVQAPNGIAFNLIGTGGFDFLVPNGGGFQAGRAGNFTIRGSANGNLSIDGVLSQGSSRATKDGIEAVDPGAMLEALAELPLATWRYKSDESSVRHIGPMAEDFHAAFGLGENETTVSPSDLASVALAAVQGLHGMVKDQRQRVAAQTAEKDAEIAALRSRIAELEREQQQRMAALEAAVAILASRAAGTTLVRGPTACHSATIQ